MFDVIRPFLSRQILRRPCPLMFCTLQLADLRLDLRFFAMMDSCWNEVGGYGADEDQLALQAAFVVVNRPSSRDRQRTPERPPTYSALLPLWQLHPLRGRLRDFFDFDFFAME